MEVRDELLTIAEIAIGIAGFSGVIAAFLERGGLHRVDRARFVFLFAMAFITLALSYVPIVVSHLVDDVNQIWPYSSAVMVIVWFMTVGSGFRYVNPALRGEMERDLNYTYLLIMIPSILNLVTQCLNLSGWLWEPGFVAYLFGLFVYLYAAGLLFVYIILFRPVELSAAQQGVEPDVE